MGNSYNSCTAIRDTYCNWYSEMDYLWMTVKEALPKFISPEYLFKNFRISKGNFFFQLTTTEQGGIDIQVKLPYLITINI